MSCKMNAASCTSNFPSVKQTTIMVTLLSHQESWGYRNSAQVIIMKSKAITYSVSGYRISTRNKIDTIGKSILKLVLSKYHCVTEPSSTSAAESSSLTSPQKCYILPTTLLLSTFYPLVLPHSKIRSRRKSGGVCLCCGNGNRCEAFVKLR